MSADETSEGLRIRSEVMGKEYVQLSIESSTDFRRPLMELVTEYGWGAVWGRTELDRKSRSLVTIAAMAATGHQGELRVHIAGALRNGLTSIEIREALLHLAVYCGAPTAGEALRTAETAIAEFDSEAE